MQMGVQKNTNLYTYSRLKVSKSSYFAIENMQRQNKQRQFAKEEKMCMDN